MYNVYKHQGSETAQYGLEIIFNRCPRYIVYSTFLLTQKQNASSSPALPNLWLLLVYHFTSNACLANFKVFLCFIMLFVFFCPEHSVVTGTGNTYFYKKLCICTGGRPKIIVEHPFVIGIRDTESVQQLKSRLSKARRVVIVGNGGIALELV